MNKVLCNKNHYYDADKFSACPHCARAKAFLERTAQTAQHAAPPAQDGPAKGGYWSLDDLRGKTSLPDTPVAGFSTPPPVQAGTPRLDIMHTTPLFPPDGMQLPVPPVPVQEQQTVCPSCGARMDGAERQPYCPFCGARMDKAVLPASVQERQSEPKPVPEPEQPLSPASEQENEIILEEPAILADEPEPAPVASQESVPVQMPKPAFFPASAPDDGRTHILYSGEMNQIEPVVGWLVCVLGGQQGLSFPLAGGRNRIGRAADMDVCLGSDPEVSRNAHCILTFDPASEAFYLQPGDGRGLTYLNDALLLTPMQLKAHDLIRTGATTLLFVPLCGESFHWNTYFHKEQK